MTGFFFQNRTYDFELCARVEQYLKRLNQDVFSVLFHFCMLKQKIMDQFETVELNHFSDFYESLSSYLLSQYQNRGGSSC